MSEYRCSAKDRREYKRLINDHLRSRGVTDFSKYDISILQGGLHYDRWEYAVGIDKPTNLVLPKQVMIHTTATYHFTLHFKISNLSITTDVFPLKVSTTGVKAEQLHFQLTVGANTLHTNIVLHIAAVKLFESGVELTIVRINKCVVPFNAFLTVNIIPRQGKVQAKVKQFSGQALLDHLDYDVDGEFSGAHQVSYTVPSKYL